MSETKSGVYKHFRPVLVNLYSMFLFTEIIIFVAKLALKNQGVEIEEGIKYALTDIGIYCSILMMITMMIIGIMDIHMGVEKK